MTRNGQMKLNVSVTLNTRGTDGGVCPFADALCSPFFMPPPLAKKLSCSLFTPTYNVVHAHVQRRPRPWTTNKVSSWNGGKAYEIGFVDMYNQIPDATLSPSSTVTLLEIEISHASEIISWNRTLCFLKNRRYKRFGYMFSLLTHKKCT